MCSYRRSAGGCVAAPAIAPPCVLATWQLIPKCVARRDKGFWKPIHVAAPSLATVARLWKFINVWLSTWTRIFTHLHPAAGFQLLTHVRLVLGKMLGYWDLACIFHCCHRPRGLRAKMPNWLLQTPYCTQDRNRWIYLPFSGSFGSYSFIFPFRCVSVPVVVSVAGAAYPWGSFTPWACKYASSPSDFFAWLICLTQ